MKTLKEQIGSELESTGKITLNSATVEAGTLAAPTDPVKEIKGPIPVVVDHEESKDPMLTKGAEHDAGIKLSEDKIKQAGAEDIKKLMDSGDIPDKVVIDDADRAAFMDAIVTGGRYTRTVTLFNGRITVEFRCRSAAESHAILAVLNIECQTGAVVSALDYSTRLRNMLLTAQVKRINSTVFPELDKPVMPTFDSVAKQTVQPKWLAAVDYWQNYENEGIVNAVYFNLRQFERKYWVMVASALDQNFWQTAGSI